MYVDATALTYGTSPLDGSKAIDARCSENVWKKSSVPPLELNSPASVGAANVPPSVAEPPPPTSTAELCTRTSRPAAMRTFSNATEGNCGAGSFEALGL